MPVEKSSVKEMFDEKIKPSLSSARKQVKPAIEKTKNSLMANKASLNENFKQIKNVTKVAFKEKHRDAKRNISGMPHELKTASGRAGYIALTISMSAFVIPLLGFITAPIALWYSKSVVKKNPKVEIAETLALVAISINFVVIGMATFCIGCYFIGSALLSNLLSTIL